MKSGKEIIRIIKDNDYLYGKDGSWRSYYQDIANFCLPRKAWINSIRVMGERLKDNFLYDVRAIRCAKEATCGFHSNLTNPSSRWFSTVMVNDRNMQSGAAQRYLKQRDDIQFDVINDSNFNNSMLENYMDHLVFGTANIMTLEDEANHVRYKNIPVEQYSIVEDAQGRVNRLYINFQYIAIQCYERWGDRCPAEVIKAVNDGEEFQTFDILFYIGPRDKRDPYKLDRSNMPWETCWIMKKPQTLLEEGGFQEFPNAVGRFWKDNNGDPRGFSPAMDALASVKLLNAEKRTFIRHAMKASDPAFMSPYKGFLNAPNFNPSAANYYDAKSFKPDSFRFLNPEGNSNLNIEAMDLEAYEIERAFFVDIFRAISNVTQDKKKRSIPEVQRLITEGMSMLGPIIGKVIDETLNPVLERTAAILERRLMFPPPPVEIQGGESKIVYLSPLARAQRQSQLIGISAWLQMIGEIASFKPEVLDPINADRVSQIIAEIQGVDPTVYYDDDYVKQIRQQRMKMQMMQAQTAMAEQGAQAAKHGAEAHKAGREAQAIGK